MSSIKLKVQISGTRNGEEWPAPGTVIALPDDEAATLIANGNAEPADGEETADFAQGDVETATKKPRGAKAEA